MDSATEYTGLTGFGPNLNILRDPRFGRGSELASEDPFLSGEFGAAVVTGMQEKDSHGYPKMLAYLKHFAAYSMEKNRNHATYNISIHDFFETYLAQYEIAFKKGGASGAMCSYNAENGHSSCANGFILNHVLRDLWGQEFAAITTDCGAITNLMGAPAFAKDAAEAAAWALNNGTDLEMGSDVFTTQNGVVDAVKQGLVNRSTVEKSVKRLYRSHFTLGRFDPIGSSLWDDFGMEHINSSFAQQVNFEATAQSLVLLENNYLPIDVSKKPKIAVLGPLAETPFALFPDYSPAWGTHHVDQYELYPSLFEEIQRANPGVTKFSRGCDITGSDEYYLRPALDLCKQSDICVLVLGFSRDESKEGKDRTDIQLPGLQEYLALQAAATGKPVVVLLMNGAQLAIDNLVGGKVNAIVEIFYPAGGARAVVETLFGRQNRFGKLPFTMYPAKYQEVQPMDNYDMAKFPGRTYKYYDEKNFAPALFPFGYGLSYTTFELGPQYTYENSILSFSIANTGSIDGEEVAMIFVTYSQDIMKKANHPVPYRQLIAFDRFSIPAKTATHAQFNVTREDIMLVNEEGNKTLYPGQYYVYASLNGRQEGPEPIKILVKSLAKL